MRLLDDVRLIESVIFAPPTISTRTRPSQTLALDRSIEKLVTMEDDAVLLHESVIRGNRAREVFVLIASMSISLPTSRRWI